MKHAASLLNLFFEVKVFEFASLVNIHLIFHIVFRGAVCLFAVVLISTLDKFKAVFNFLTGFNRSQDLEQLGLDGVFSCPESTVDLLVRHTANRRSIGTHEF